MFANGPLSRLHFQNMLQYKYLVKRPLVKRSFGMTLLEQLGDASYLVVCAACCYMQLEFAAMHLCDV